MLVASKRTVATGFGKQWLAREMQKFFNDGCCPSQKIRVGRSRVRIPVPAKGFSLKIFVERHFNQLAVEVCIIFVKGL